MSLFRRPTLADFARQGLAVLLAGSFLSQQTLAATPPPPMPTGGAYTAGAGSIKTSGNAVTINQSTLRGIIDWSTFSIGQGGIVTFNNGSGATLNRVNGGQMSSILGSLSASGSVYLINPEGVLIGPGAHINTGGDFVASSLKLSGDAFMNGGSLLFQGDSKNMVVNLGDIFSKDGSIFLIGHEVNNSGHLSAANGTIGLGAGSEVLLNDSTGDQRVFVKAPGADVTNTGEIAAAQIELKAKGGNIYALAGNNGGSISATGTATINGHVWLISDGAKAQVAGSIFAQNANGTGGDIETSGHDLDISHATVSTGRGGNWLLDPVDLSIDSAAATTIQNSLASTNVTVQTTATDASGPGTQADGNGDINVDSSIAWSSGNSLTLSAYRNINVNDGVTVSNAGAGNLTLRADNASTGTGAVSFNGSGNIDYSASTGNVAILYDPVGDSKYTAPVDYSSVVKTNSAWVAPTDDSVSAQLSAYMLVNNPADLQNVNTNLAGTYALGQDIDLNSVAFTPIGQSSSFSGIFDGQNHTINNLLVNNYYNAGLFADSSGIIRNLNVTGANVTGTYDVGALVGYNSGTVANTFVTGTVTNQDDDCEDLNFVGGLVGENGGTIINSEENVAISASVGTYGYLDNLQFYGGLVGYNYGPITNSLAAGSITLTNSQSEEYYSETYLGGLVGVNESTISNSYSTANIAIINQQNQYMYAGGLAGASWGGTVSNSFAAGSVPSGTNITSGGLVGDLEGTVTNSYWDTQVTGQDNGAAYGDSTGMTGLTTATLTNGSLPSGLAAPIWFGVEGHNPYLYWQGTPITGTVWNGDSAVPSATVAALLGGSSLGSTTTNTNGFYSFFEPKGTIQNGATVLTYLTSGGVGNTASDGKGTLDYTGMDIYTNTLRILNATNSQYSGIINALSSSVGTNFGPNILFTIANDVLTPAAATDIQLLSSTGLHIDEPISGQGNVLINSTGDLTLDGANITASGTGDALILTSGGALANNGAEISVTGGGRWLVYSQNPANDTLGSLANPDFWQYNAAYGSATTAQATGNGVLYALAPTLAVDLTGTVSKVYDATTTATLSADNITATGSANGDVATISVTGLTGTYGDKNVGTSKNVALSGTPTITVTHNGNPVYGYQATVQPEGADAVGVITAASLSVTVTANNKTYDGNTSATGSIGTLTGVLGEDSVALSGTPAYIFDNKNAGTGKTVTASGLTLTGEDGGNYTLSSLTTTGNINPATLTASINGANKVYDGTTADSASLTLHGVIGEDQVSGAANYAFANKNVGVEKTVTASNATLNGTDVSNYTLGTITNGAANITAATVTASVLGANRVYDATTADNASLQLSGVITGDQVSGTAGYSFSDKNASTGKTVTAANASLTGSDASNYILSTVSNGHADITPATLTASVNASSKVYDATTTDNGSLMLQGVIGEDQVSGTATYAFANKNVGSAKSVSASNASLSGTDAGNYTMGTITNGTANITPAQLTATYAANSKVYDGTTAANATLGGLNGVLASDVVSLQGGTYNFSDKNVGTNKAVNTSGAVLTGTDAGNYTLTLMQAGAASVTPAQLLYTANTGVVRPFGAANPAFSGTVAGLVGGDTLTSVTSGSLLFTSPATFSSNVGSYAVNGSGLTLTTGNYTLAQAPSNATAFTVNPITISIGSVSRTAGTPNPTFTVSYSGPSSDYLASLLSNLTLVTNAPAGDAPGVYQITAVVPSSLAGSIMVQPGILTITNDNRLVVNGTPQILGTVPASLESQDPGPSAPLPPANSSGNPQIPGNAINQFQVVIAPSQDWISGNLQGGQTDALSHASFTDSFPNTSTFAAGAQ